MLASKLHSSPMCSHRRYVGTGVARCLQTP